LNAFLSSGATSAILSLISSCNYLAFSALSSGVCDNSSNNFKQFQYVTQARLLKAIPGQNKAINQGISQDI